MPNRRVLRLHLPRLCLLALALAVGVGARAQEQSPKAIAEQWITADAVKPLIVALSDGRFEGRGGGYPGERRAGDAIANAYAQLGLQPMGDLVNGRRTFFQEFAFMPHFPIHPWEKLRSRNILAFLEGSDPVLKNEIIVIGAHYDGQGMAGQADAFRSQPTDPNSKPGNIWHSANDNLSSVSGVLSIARAMKQGKVSVKRSVLFIAFGAEEHGEAGSVYYVNHPAFDLPRHAAMINMECIGRMPDQPPVIDAMMTAGFWNGTLKSATELLGTKVQPNVPIAIPDSDHYPFASSKIPAVTLAGPQDPDRHRPSDTSDKIDFSRVAEVSRIAFLMALSLADRTEHLAFSPFAMPDFGVLADQASPAECDAIHLKPEEGCVRITGIIPNGPGARVGLKQGDAMLQVADHIFRRDDTLGAIQKFYESVLRGKYGKTVNVVLLRDGRRFEFTLPIS